MSVSFQPYGRLDAEQTRTVSTPLVPLSVDATRDMLHYLVLAARVRYSQSAIFFTA